MLKAIFGGSDEPEPPPVAPEKVRKVFERFKI